MLSKYLLPLVAFIGIGAGSAGTILVNKSLRPVINVEEKIVHLKCPEVKPCNGIDFDKIKSRNLTIQNEQHLTVSGDSLFISKIIEEVKKAVKEEIKSTRIARCK